MLWISKAYAQPVVSPFFEQHNDVGGVRLPGDLRYRPEQQEYEISASGSNIWLDKDEFHFAWRKLKGDFILQARVRFLGEGKDPHRKVGWMIRDELSTASVMTAVTVHGDGLTALQFRKESGKNVEEIRSTVSAPDMIQLERRGKRLLMSVARFGDPYQTVSVTQVPSADEVYAGLFVCSHNNEVLEKAIFSNVQIIIPTPPGFQPYKDYLGSHIETLDVSSGHRVIQHTDWQKSLQAPNWMPDGKSLL